MSWKLLATVGLLICGGVGGFFLCRSLEKPPAPAPVQFAPTTFGAHVDRRTVEDRLPAIEALLINR